MRECLISFLAVLVLGVFLTVAAQSFTAVQFEITAKTTGPVTLTLADGYGWDSSITEVMVDGIAYPVGYSHNDTCVFIPDLPKLDGAIVTGLQVVGSELPTIAILHRGKTHREIVIAEVP